MAKPEEMVLKTVHDLGVAGDWDVYNYTGLSPVEAGWALDALYRKGYLKASQRNASATQTNTAKSQTWKFSPFLSLRRKAKKLRRGYLTLMSRCAYR